MNVETFRSLQKEYGGWNENMEKVVLILYTWTFLCRFGKFSYILRCCIALDISSNYYTPTSIDREHIVFVLSVCLPVVNFNICYNFWTIREKDSVFGIHTPLMKPFTLTSRLMTLWPCLWPLCLKYLFQTLLRWGLSVSQTHLVLLKK